VSYIVFDTSTFHRNCNQSLFTNNAVNSNLAHGMVYLIQHYVRKFVNELQQVGGVVGALQSNTEQRQFWRSRHILSLISQRVRWDELGYLW